MAKAKDETKNEETKKVVVYSFECKQYPALKFEPSKGSFENFSSGKFKTKNSKIANFLRNYKGIRIDEIKETK